MASKRKKQPKKYIDTRKPKNIGKSEQCKPNAPQDKRKRFELLLRVIRIEQYVDIQFRMRGPIPTTFIKNSYHKFKQELSSIYDMLKAYTPIATILVIVETLVESVRRAF